MGCFSPIGKPRLSSWAPRRLRLFANPPRALLTQRRTYISSGDVSNIPHDHNTGPSGNLPLSYPEAAVEHGNAQPGPNVGRGSKTPSRSDIETVCQRTYPLMFELIESADCDQRQSSHGLAGILRAGRSRWTFRYLSQSGPRRPGRNG